MFSQSLTKENSDEYSYTKMLQIPFFLSLDEFLEIELLSQFLQF